MNTGKLIFIALLATLSSFAQDTIRQLDEVRVADVQWRVFSRSRTLKVVPDSLLWHQNSLKTLLSRTTALYFRENGAGMVASVSFRGTTASQTAVVWNGIAINSLLNGQTDFNTILTEGFGHVVVRPGGGGVGYGSGAIGGTVHLDNVFRYGQEFRHSLYSRYGSFDTYGVAFHVRGGSERWSVDATLSRNESQNDYAIPGGRNRNGHYYNMGSNVAIGYRPNAANEFRLYQQVYDGHRHFSLLNPSDTPTQYLDFNSRHMLEWLSEHGRFVGKAKVAYVTERYRYFEDVEAPSYRQGRSRTLLVRYDGTYSFGNGIKLNGIADVSESEANGDDIRRADRRTGTAAISLRHELTPQFTYEAGIRKDAVSGYASPLLFSAGVAFQPNKVFRWTANLSRNFRAPTFNDLYWQGAGNESLRPEVAVQGEIGQEVTTRFGRFGLTLFDGRIRDMIRWVPVSGGVFRPENVDRVHFRGIETQYHFEKQSARWMTILDASYAYTQSRNVQTGNQLMYVPYHNAMAAVSVRYRHATLRLEQRYTGSVYLQSDNDPTRKLPDYALSNAAIEYASGAITAGCRIDNIGNVSYQAMEGRYMPLRHYTFYITLIL